MGVYAHGPSPINTGRPAGGTVGVEGTTTTGTNVTSGRSVQENVHIHMVAWRIIWRDRAHDRLLSIFSMYIFIISFFIILLI